ncbi:MAG: hypothetical protein K0S38_123 [Candidatus Paceibacter sp.]|jgi:hypothetical protein|nr:hypothetical protein [Candidatus Paceibacter sp.]
MHYLRNTIIAVSILWSVQASYAEAARIQLVDQTSASAGNEIEVAVQLDTEGQTINALDGSISFSSELSLLSITETDALVPLWMKNPAVRNGSITFSGIIPGGYKGDLSVEWQGTRPGTFMVLTFKTIKAGDARITLNGSNILLNDGKATPATISPTDPLVIAITEQKVKTVTTNEPRIDTIAPDAFTPLLKKNETFFDGKYFIIFSTQDRQSGIDHYEVAEYPTLVDVLDKNLQWEVSNTPYILKDQSLTQYIYVKAIDRQGNDYVATLSPLTSNSTFGTRVVVGLLVLLGIGSLLVVFFYKRTRNVVTM